MMMVILDNGAAFDNLDSALGASRVETRSTLQPTLTHLRWCTVNIIIADVTIFIIIILIIVLIMMISRHTGTVTRATVFPSPSKGRPRPMGIPPSTKRSFPPR